MQNQTFKYSNFHRLTLALIAFVVAIGCDSGPDISVYKIAREDSEIKLDTGEVVEEQIIGVIVPKGEQAWFFKLRGSVERTNEYAAVFREIVEAVTFDGTGTAQWKLPEGWRDVPGGGFTFAKWVEESSGVEATVSVLAIGQGTWEDYIVVNVNRWRGQVGLPPQQWDNMSETLETLEALTSDEEKPAYYVRLVGTGGGQGSMGGAPFLEAMRRAQEAEQQAANENGAASEDGERANAPNPETEAKPPESTTERPKHLTYSVPDSWREVPPKNSMRTAQFEGQVGEDTVEIIVSQAGGEIDMNMKMWLGQVGGKVTDGAVEGIVNSGTKVENETSPATMYRIVGRDHGGESDESMLVSQVPITDEYSWYVKMVGSADAVDSQQELFEAFVSSIRFDKP